MMPIFGAADVVGELNELVPYDVPWNLKKSKYIGGAKSVFHSSVDDTR